MPLRTVAASAATEESLVALEELTSLLPAGDFRAALEYVSGSLRSGEDVVIGKSSEPLTTTQVARLLGVSRAHLYKVLDSGELKSHRVGNSARRVNPEDLASYLDAAEDARRAHSDRVAHIDATYARAIDEM